MDEKYKRFTRGNGLLESFLSKKRMKLAKNIINENDIKKERILDIGCGTYPLFLTNIDFKERYGLDKIGIDEYDSYYNLKLINYDICLNNRLPFPNEFFDVITLLAVIEHIDLKQTHKILNNCFSLLKEDGILIITTPAKWSDNILKIMSKIRLISPEELDEHKENYNLKKLNNVLCKANFMEKNIKDGYFECFLNLWICAKKEI